MEFFISDLHFGDEGIIKYGGRPFKIPTEMDETIIRNWNGAAEDDDTVFVAGDVSSYDKAKTAEIIKMLKGKKYLILGNHDTQFTEDEWKDIGFEFVSRFPIAVAEFFWISHEPMFLNTFMPYANIHGHIHSNIMSTGVEPNQYVNVSVEHINYTPISFVEIKKRFAR